MNPTATPAQTMRRRKYTFAGLSDTKALDLDTLARTDGAMPEAAVKLRVATAVHEAVHIVAAVYCTGSVMKVWVTPNGKARRSGVLGKVDLAVSLRDEDAFCSLVGYAWEELHGDTAHAEHDLRSGYRHADAGGHSRIDLLNEAREFVRAGSAAFQTVAKILLALTNAAGELGDKHLAQLERVIRECLGRSRRPKDVFAT
jgi:hypothetical protein